MTLKPYSSLIKSRAFALIIYSLNLVLALIASSRLNGSDLFTFVRNLAHSLVSYSAIVLSVYIYNDYTDMKIDRINKLDRPLVTGEASQNEARILIIVLAIIGLTAALTINSTVFLLAVAYFVLGASYSFPPIRLKNKFLINKITVAVGIAMAYLIGGAVAGAIPVPVFLMAAYGSVSGLSTSIVIDLRDMGGDESHEVETLAVAWNPSLTVKFAMALIGLMWIVMVVGFVQLGFNVAFLILASCGFAAWIYVLYPLLKLWKDPSFVEDTVHKKISLIGMTIQALLVVGAVA